MMANNARGFLGILFSGAKTVQKRLLMQFCRDNDLIIKAIIIEILLVLVIIRIIFFCIWGIDIFIYPTAKH